MSGLIGWWPLLEWSGQSNDLSGYGRHGSIAGGVTQGVAGKGGLTAYALNGVDGYVDNGDPPSLSRFTIAAWVRTNSPNDSANQCIFTGRANNDFTLRKKSDNTWNAWYWDGTNSHQVTTTQGIDSNWHHIAFSWDGSTIRLYLDGSQVDSLSASASMVSANATSRIGSYDTGKWFFNGDICDVRLYDRALMGREVQALYEWGSVDYVTPTTPDHYWKLDGDATDSSGGLNGTTSGSITWEAGIRGQSAHFDGTDNEITFGNLNPSNVTVGQWVKWDGTYGLGSHQIIHNEEYQYELGIADGMTGFTDGEIGYAVETGQGWAWWNTGFICKPNIWYHIALVHDGSYSKIYVNGVEVDRTANSGGIATNTSSFMIGDRGNNGFHFNGEIDEVRWFASTRQSYEIYEMYQHGTRGRDLRKQVVNVR